MCPTVAGPVRPSIPGQEVAQGSELYLDKTAFAGAGNLDQTVQNVQQLAVKVHQLDLAEEPDLSTRALTDLSNVVTNLAANARAAFLAKVSGMGVKMAELASDLTTQQKAEIRSKLGYGTAATEDTGTGSGDIPILDSDGRLAATILGVKRIRFMTLTAYNALQSKDNDTLYFTSGD